MSDLIPRLRNAAEGSQELSAEIARDVVGLRFHQWPVWVHVRSRMHDASALGPCPAYTTSLDDAVTLVPENWSWSVGTDFDMPGRAILTWGGVTSDDRPQRITITAETPALALCIAALEARNTP